MKYFIALRSKLIIINNFKPGNVRCLHGYEIYGSSSYNSIKIESLRISDKERELERERERERERVCECVM